MDELPDGGDELPDVAEHEQPHDAQRDAGKPAVREEANISGNIMTDFLTETLVGFTRNRIKKFHTCFLL